MNKSFIFGKLYLLLSVCAIGLAAYCPPVCAARLMLQVEDFEGPWRRQTNIEGYIGSGFCTSNANPKVASTVMKKTVRIREAGRYFVWVRAYTSPNYKRALRVAVGGKRLAVTHREEQRRWSWQRAGELKLDSGPVEVAVHDADVGYETADAVLLTDNAQDDPMSDEEERGAYWKCYPDGLPDEADALRYNIDACLELCKKHEPPATKDEWERRRGELLVKLRRTMGLVPWPEKTPLNARVTGTAEREDYTLENIVFESRPNFYVTANVYIPKGVAKPMPAVIVAMGHAMKEGKNYGLYQSAQVGLARQGLVVLGYDPINQGERRGRGFAHQVAYPSFMTGLSAEGVMAWDTIRALDYLETRSDVDPKRIGLTGNSGGGLNTLYTAPVEPRIAAAASIGCTCEFYAFLKEGGNHCICNHQIGIVPLMEEFEVVGLCVPRPYMAGAGVKDGIFPIAGVRRTMKRVKGIYSLYDGAERAALAEGPDEHGWYLPLREAAYGWFSKWLLNRGDGSPIDEPAFEPEEATSKDLQCFKDGKRPEDAITFVSIVRERAGRLIEAYPPAPGEAAEGKARTAQLRSKLWDTLGGKPADFEPETTTLGNFDWRGRTVERVAIQTEAKMFVTALLCKPEGARGRLPVVICMFDGGKAEARSSELVAGVLDREVAVLALDPRGIGEAKVKYNHCVSDSIVLGRPLLAQQVWDVLAAAKALAHRKDVNPARIAVCGVGSVGMISTISGALSKELAAVAAVGSPGSLTKTIEDPVKQPYWLFAPNILEVADVPQLAGMTAPRRFLALNAVGFGARKMPADAAKETFEYATASYRSAGAPDAVRIETTDEWPPVAVDFLADALSSR